MAYNRSLDLMAISLAATAAGLPVKAAKYMHAAAKDVEAAQAAVDIISAVNIRETAAKKKKKKAKSSFQQMFAGVEDDDDITEDETAETESEKTEDDEKDDAEVMKVESSTLASRMRKALAGSEELDDEDEREAEVDSEEKDEDASVTAARKIVARADAAKKLKAKKVKAMPELEGDLSELEPNEVGQECKEEVPDHKESARFARTLRNLAARQKASK